MFVILDSTEFFDAPQADSNSFKILEEFIRRTRSRLVIPEVVFKETLNHVRESLERLPREIKSMQRQYDRIKTTGCAELVVTQPDFARALELYEVAFRQKLERSFQAVFLPLAATHESVLDRALRRQRPFLQNKDGYRDTLIWLSIKTRIVEQPGEYLFVTNNSKDFSDKDLVEELGNLAQGTSLRFENDLKGFINNYAKGALERLNAVRTRLQRALQLPGIDLKEALSDPGSDVVRSMSNKLRLRGYQYRKIEEPYHIDDFSEPEEIQVDEVFRAQDDVIVECSVQYPCAITGYVYHAEAISENEFFEVTDWNWNEHYAEVQFSATVETKILVRLSEERLEPDEAPVDEVQGTCCWGESTVFARIYRSY